MKKVRANALWNKLTAEQRATLDKWLFEERIGYAAAWARAQKELGFEGSIGSLYRYYRRREDERVMTEFTDLRNDVAAIRNAPGDAASTRDASMKVLGQFLFQQIRQSPEKVKEWGAIASLIVDNDRNELLRELKDKELKLREKTLEFAKVKFQTDMVEQALGALPDLHELERARRAAVPDAYVENAHLNRARRKMFGVVWEVRPETPEEEAAMLAAKREREAQQNEAVASEPKERITEPQPPTPESPHYQEYLEWKAKRKAESQESPAQAAVVSEAEHPPGMGET